MSCTKWGYHPFHSKSKCMDDYCDPALHTMKFVTETFKAVCRPLQQGSPWGDRKVACIIGCSVKFREPGVLHAIKQHGTANRWTLHSTYSLRGYMHQQCTLSRRHDYHGTEWLIQIFLLLRTRSYVWPPHFWDLEVTSKKLSLLAQMYVWRRSGKTSILRSLPYLALLTPMIHQINQRDGSYTMSPWNHEKHTF